MSAVSLQKTNVLSNGTLQKESHALLVEVTYCQTQAQDLTALGSPDSLLVAGVCLNSSVPGHPASPKGTGLATGASVDSGAHLGC